LLTSFFRFVLGCCSTVLILCCSSCEYLNFSKNQQEAKGKIVARVNNDYLYESDLNGLYNSNNAKVDSLSVVREYIDNWAYSKLMVKKATDFLPKNSLRDIERKVDEYRSSLYTYQFEKELINEKVNLEISQEEIDLYYAENEENLPLPHAVIQCQYVFLNKSSSKLDSIKYWFKNPSDDNLGKIKSTGYQFASNFSMEADWVSWDKLQAKLPKKIDNPKSFLKKKKYFEMEDDNQLYLVRIKDYAFEGENSPKMYAEQDIKKIIVNKRKQEYLQRIKNNIFNEAKNANRIETY